MGADLVDADMRAIKDAELVSFELYNLAADIGETQDLAGVETGRLRSMVARLQRLYSEVRAETPFWPAWQWPRYGRNRVREFREALGRGLSESK